VTKKLREARARDFVADAFAHSKFIAYSGLPLLKATLGDRDLDQGFIEIESADDVARYVKAAASFASGSAPRRDQ
jgi:catalase